MKLIIFISLVCIALSAPFDYEKPNAEYRITYFNGRGRAEAIRLILELAGKKYENNMFEGSQWPEIKKKLYEDGSLAYGSVPMLENKGNKIVQSLAIGRYLGRQLNLYGSNDDEKWQIDVLLDGTNDLRVFYYDVVFGGNEESAKKFKSETAPLWLGHFQKLKQKNNGDWFVGKNPSIADCYIYDILDVMNSYIPGIMDKYTNLQKFMNLFAKIPNIDSYLKSDRRLKD